MPALKLFTEKAEAFIDRKEFEIATAKVELQHQVLVSKTGKGNEFLGWLDLPEQLKSRLISNINDAASALRKNSDLFIVTGIGGSYLGARAVIEALNSFFPYLSEEPAKPYILYAGHQLSEDYLSELLKILDHKDYSLVVISKSGTTTEPAIAFRILKKHIEKKYGKAEAKSRIIAITDRAKGALKKMADEEGYLTYTIPDNVGGRYSVLTPVGLLPIAVAGFDINQLLEGALNMKKRLYADASSITNPAIRYSLIRHLLYKKGMTTELLVNFNPGLYYFCEWWKQLFGESEGKENKGIFPASANFTTDLHSLGQFIQEGTRNIFETVISVEHNNYQLEIPFMENDLDGLNYIAGKKIDEVNKKAEEGTLLAHHEGKVPVMRISVPVLNETSLGELIYFFEFACAIGGYLLDVNPFDQPGVEAYKNNMFRLLGKPGY